MSTNPFHRLRFILFSSSLTFSRYFNRGSLLNRANASAASIAAAESASVALLKNISSANPHSSTPAASADATAAAAAKGGDDESDDDDASASTAKPLAGQDVALINGFLVDVYTKQNRIAEAIEVRKQSNIGIMAHRVVHPSYFSSCVLWIGFSSVHSDCAQVDIDRRHPARVLELSRATVAEREQLSVSHAAE